MRLPWVPADFALSQSPTLTAPPHTQRPILLRSCFARADCPPDPMQEVWMGFPFLLLIWKPSPKCWLGFCYSAVCNRFTHTHLNSIVLCHATSGPGLLPLKEDHAWWCTYRTSPNTSKCFSSRLSLSFCTSAALRVHFLYCISPWRQRLGLPWGKPSTHSAWDTRSLKEA